MIGSGYLSQLLKERNNNNNNNNINNNNNNNNKMAYAQLSTCPRK